jgi:endonuclease G
VPSADAARFRLRATMFESGPADPNGFERVIGTSDLLSINFLERGRRAADAVCRIRVPADGGGWMATGFLVGPRLLLTNNHVLSSPAEAGQAECELGFEADLEGVLKAPVQFNLLPEEIFFTDIATDFTLVAVAPYAENGVPLQTCR